MSWKPYKSGDPGIALWDACLQAGAPMPITDGMRILEIGACESDFLERASAAWPDVTWVGLDQRPRKQSVDRFTTVKGDVMHPELFEPESFDAIISLSAIEHVGLGHYGDPKDPDGDSKAVAHAWRWLKPGGFFYFDVPYNPTGYRVQTTECRVYDDAAIGARLTGALPVADIGQVARSAFFGWSHAKAAGTLVNCQNRSGGDYWSEDDKPTEPVKPFHYCAMVWRKA